MPIKRLGDVQVDRERCTATCHLSESPGAAWRALIEDNDLVSPFFQRFAICDATLVAEMCECPPEALQILTRMIDVRIWWANERARFDGFWRRPVDPRLN